MKKHQFRILVVALFAAGLVFTLGACKSKTARERLAEKSVANMIEKATGGQAKVDLKDGTIRVKTAEGETEIGSSKTWPNDLPADVLKPSFGKIVGVIRSSQEEKKYWNVSFEGGDAGAFDKYADELKSKGWEIKMTTKTGDGGMFQAQKEKVMIVATFTNSGKNVNIVVTNQIDQ
jgi:hypothetical protein